MAEENPMPSEEPMEEDTQPTNTNYKHLDHLKSMQQKRRTQELYNQVIAFAKKEKVAVTRLLGLLLKRDNSKTVREIGNNFWDIENSNHDKPVESALALYSSLGRRSYTNQKKLIDKAGHKKILIPWKHLRLKLKAISRVVQHLNHPFTGVYFPPTPYK